MKKILPPKFFNRPVLEVAPELLGKYLVRDIHGKMESHMITEVEAYDGEEDLASHASKGETERTSVMYGPAGRWYVYLIYGMYDMLNIVCGPERYPAAILIRGLVGVNGPGKVTQKLQITRTYNTLQSEKDSGLWIEDRGTIIDPTQIESTARIGVAYAKDWANKPYRYVLKQTITK